jgi:hypothetical protein
MLNTITNLQDDTITIYDYDYDFGEKQNGLDWLEPVAIVSNEGRWLNRPKLSQSRHRGWLLTVLTSFFLDAHIQ